MALLPFTSGTTGRPKGVMLSHRNLLAGARIVTSYLELTAEDRILHVLPLHHVHGIVNVLCCALWSGAVCELLPRFEHMIDDTVHLVHEALDAAAALAAEEAGPLDPQLADGAGQLARAPDGALSRPWP